MLTSNQNFDASIPFGWTGEGWTEQSFDGSLSSLRVMMCMALFDENKSSVPVNDVMSRFIASADFILSNLSSVSHKDPNANKSGERSINDITLRGIAISPSCYHYLSKIKHASWMKIHNSGEGNVSNNKRRTISENEQENNSKRRRVDNDFVAEEGLIDNEYKTLMKALKDGHNNHSIDANEKISMNANMLLMRDLKLVILDPSTFYLICSSLLESITGKIFKFVGT